MNHMKRIGVSVALLAFVMLIVSMAANAGHVDFQNPFGGTIVLQNTGDELPVDVVRVDPDGVSTVVLTGMFH